MKNFASALTALAFALPLACAASSAGAQTATATATPTATPTTAPAGPGMVGRFTNWFSGWDRGWESGTTMRALASPYTYHYSRDPDHADVYMLGLERQRADGFTIGGTFFRNSFGQPSAYLYVGQRFDRLAGVDGMFAQVTGGLLYGYKEPYQHKVPLNYKGFSPGIVPSVGWQFSPVWSAQLNFLGNSALMVQVSADFK